MELITICYRLEGDVYTCTWGGRDEDMLGSTPLTIRYTDNIVHILKNHRWVYYNTKYIQNKVKDEASYLDFVQSLNSNVKSTLYNNYLCHFMARFIYDRVLEKKYTDLKIMKNKLQRTRDDLHRI